MIKNNLWYFADSFGNFNYHDENGNDVMPISLFTGVADYLNLIEINNAKSGADNHIIFSNLLKNLSEYKEKDIIIFQTSFLQRHSYAYYNDEFNINERPNNTLASYSKNFYLMTGFNNNSLHKLPPKALNAVNYFLDYSNKNTFNIWYKLFYDLKIIVNFLEKNNIKFYILPLKNEILNVMDGIKHPYFDFYALLDEFNLLKNCLKIENQLKPIYEASFFKNVDGKHHHLELETIKKYSNTIIESNFK